MSHTLEFRPNLASNISRDLETPSTSTSTAWFVKRVTRVRQEATVRRHEAAGIGEFWRRLTGAPEAVTGRPPPLPLGVVGRP